MRSVLGLGLVVCAVALSGCSIHPRMDTAYDPLVTAGEAMIDQIPNNTVSWNPDGTVRGSCYPKYKC